MKKPTYQHIASLLDAIKTCKECGNNEWQYKHKSTLKKIMDNSPSGSGIDCGTKLDEDSSTRDRLVFELSYHHMDDQGGYDGWTEHKLIVKPSLIFSINLRLTGRDRNHIKEYLYDVYSQWLQSEIEL